MGHVKLHVIFKYLAKTSPIPLDIKFKFGRLDNSFRDEIL